MFKTCIRIWTTGFRELKIFVQRVSGSPLIKLSEYSEYSHYIAIIALKIINRILKIFQRPFFLSITDWCVCVKINKFSQYIYFHFWPFSDKILFIKVKTYFKCIKPIMYVYYELKMKIILEYFYLMINLAALQETVCDIIYGRDPYVGSPWFII